MDAEFWHQRWQNNQIGFHEDDINAHLQSFWHRVGASAQSRVLVPLCGKSLDLLWLRSQGHSVIGVEISTIAINAFFEENGITPMVREEDRFRVREADGITLLEGDFFDLTADDLTDVETVYDRASLIALPTELRRRYVEHLSQILSQGVKILLVTLQYPQKQMSGPPFSVDAQEVSALYQHDYQIEELFASDILEDNPGFKRRGLSSLVEKVYSLSSLK